MKHKTTRQLLSLLLAFVMVIGMLPMSALTALAAGPTEIEELSLSFISPSEIPAVGGNIRYRTNGRLQENDDRIDLTSTDLIWKIDDSTVTVNPSDLDTGMYFEAGRSYSAEIIVKVLEPEQYTITENTKITLTDSVNFTYTSAVSSLDGKFARMKLTITMNGERTYPDITRVVFKDFASPAHGMSKSACGTDIYYNNCEMTSGTWLGDVWGEGDTFVAGETYTYSVVLTAREGYKFDENVIVILTNGVIKEPSYYAFGADNRTLTLDYTYTLSGITWLGTVDATITRFEHTLTPVAGECAISLFTDTLAVDENSPYEIVGQLDRSWHSEDGTELTSNDQFAAGRTYYFDYAYSIKTEYEDQYRFVADGLTTTITGNSYTGAGFQKADRVETDNLDNTYVKFRYYFTAQFPEGVGTTASNPAVCYSYDEFKYAMENPDIRYVALGNVEDTLPSIPHNEEKEPGGITRTAIVVRGHKDLNLLGDAVFTCPISGNYDLKYYIQLLKLTDATDSSLYIHGDGSLTYEGGTLNFVNSVITVEGGHLALDGATVRGSNGNHTGFCYGINALYGSVSIDGGATVIGEVYGGDYGISAMALSEEGETRSLSVNIYDGKFYVERDTGNGSADHGIVVHNDCGLRIYGMTSDGIELGRYAADTLGDYVADGSSMTVNGFKTSPASCGTTDGKVEVYTEIAKAEIYVETPVAGEGATIYPEHIYWVPEGCTVESIVWYENGALWNNNYGSERFEAGSTYRVEVTLVADNGVKFADPLTSAKISYKTATVSAYQGNAEKGIVMSVDFGVCPDTVGLVELQVNAPKDGMTVNYTVTEDSAAYGIDRNETQWLVSDNGITYTAMNQGDKFVGGKYYRFVTWVGTTGGYEFPVYDDGVTIQPGVSVTVNGYYAAVTKAYEQDPSRYVAVEYDFGMCNDDVIENIVVENVIAPVAGEKPTYTYSISGSGYQMNTAKNAYYDAYWKNPPERWYYIKNGIGWFDVTEGDWVYENETFIAGHEYQVRVYLKTEDGYEFAHTKNYEPTVSATVNGYAAGAITTGSDCTWYQQVQYTFICKKQDVSTIMIYGLDEPRGDKVPDREVTTAYPEYYTVEYVNWYDCEDNLLYGEDTFRSGERYKVEIKIVPTKADGVYTAQFVTPVKVYIDGQEVTERLNWDAVYASKDAVYVYYTFLKGASAPEIGAFVTGSVTSFNDANGDVALQLIPQGLTEPTYETIVKGNTVNFSFASVAAGTYTLKASKANHVTREYTVVVSNSSVIQDVKIHLLGDVTGDGKVNAMDKKKIYNHINGELLTGYEFDVANVKVDTKVNALDKKMIYNHINGESLWE